MPHRATCSFHYARPDGSEGYVAVDQVVSADHEAFKGRESLFVAVPDTDLAPVPEKPVQRRTAAKKA